MIISHGKRILAEHYAKYHYKQARTRLIRASIALVVLATLYLYLGIQIASAQGAFIPN